MQPTIPQTQTTVTADMDLPAVQSMDWLFKKERIYLLAQFWQQRATLAEKEVNTLKEQLYGNTQPTSVSPLSPTTSSASSNNSTASTTNPPLSTVNTTVTASAILAAVSPTSALQTAATTIPNKHSLNNNSINSNNNNSNSKLNSFTVTQQNGLPSPASTPPSSNCGSASTTPTSTPTSNKNDIGDCIRSDSTSPTPSTALNCLSTTNRNAITNKLLNFNNCAKMDDGSSMTSLTTMTADIKLDEQLHKDNNNTSSCNNNNSSSSSNSNNTNNNNSSNSNTSANSVIRSSTPIDKNLSSDCPSNLSNVNNSGNNNSSSSSSSSNSNSGGNSKINISGNNNASGNNSSNKSLISSSNSTSTTMSSSNVTSLLMSPSSTATTTAVTDELAAKDKEIKALIDEVTRLTALQETHIVQIQRLEERLELKLQHIQRLESQLHTRLDREQIDSSSVSASGTTNVSNQQSQPLNLVDESIVKKENSNIIPPLDISSPAVAAAAAAAASVATDAKQFQELLLERTKALAAAQSEALKSSANSDGSRTESAKSEQKPGNEAKSTTLGTPTASSTPSINHIDVASPTRNTKSTAPGNFNNENTLKAAKTTSRSANSTPFNTTPLLSGFPGFGPVVETNFDSQHSPRSVSSGANGSLSNVDQFSSFLGEEIVNSWRRGFEFPPLPLPPLSCAPNQHLLPPMAAVAAAAIAPPSSTNAAVPATSTPIPHFSTAPSPSTSSTTALLNQLANSTFSNSLQADANSTGGSLSNCHQDIDKASSHHESSSTASTPNLQDARSADEHMNGSCGPTGLSSMAMQQMMKNQAEDNNNSLGPMPHVPAGFLPGLPFQFQDRGHFRFAEDLQLPPGSMAGRLGDSLIPKSDPMEAKLQEMLRYNMDKYANQNLDTLNISRRIRELLSVHNIGQRIFAKYILGLSQGTVSELLSKPKPWDKLTEKGRDSYRKMHAWGCDDNAVLLLKSLIPKKDSGMPQYGRPDEGMSDDRIAHILSEASNLMKTPQGHNPASHLQQQQAQQHQHQQQAAAAQHFQQAAAAAAAAAAVQQQQQQAQQHQAQQQQQQQQQSLHQSSAGQEDSHSNEDSKSPPSHSTSPFYKDSLQRRLKKYDNDDISQDKVARIYQEELAKLMSRGPRDAFQSGGMPPAIPVNANQQSQMPDDNIRMALEAYHRELAKLQQTGGALPNFPNLPGLLALQQHALNGAQDLTCKKDKTMKVNGQQNSFSMDSCDQSTKDSTSANEEALRHSSAFSLVRPKQEPGTPAPANPTATTPSTAPSPLSNSILPPAMTPNEDFSSSASPLQRMASITNSLITQPPVTPHHSQPQRPMKAVLPPITQQQFDMFNNLNTEDIVRRVKEALSQYSISQRLFGESVLGLSQGSVSDLLARPKPWHMLTQKGREPFIRMKMFLEDENAVHKLVASQYKIAPEKLMRTGNYSGSPQIPAGLSQKMVPMQKMMNEVKMPDTPQHLMQLQASAMAHIPTSQHQGMLLTPPGLPPHHAISIPNHNDKKPMMMPSIHSPQQNNAMRGMHQHMSPTVYEMAALTHDLDTQVITTKIKEALLANNIGQKIFGEAVLGLSQGSVSELLSKPKPWHMLSIKGREPFIRMQLWLSDANNVERLQALKIERREASKRRRSTGAGNQDNSSDTSSNDTADFYSASPGPGSVGSAAGVPPNKKQRVLFSEEQKEALRLAFALDPYPNVATIEFLANELGLATRTITNWFHNHRMRLKQQVPHGGPSEPVPSRENQSSTPFDPVQFRILLNQRLMELQKERMGLSGVPIPYPPYFAANPNLAALIGRGLLPGNESSLAALNNAFKEQMSGLDLTMNALKRERNDDFEDDGEEESHLSDNESLDGSDVKSESLKEAPTSSSRLSGSSLVQSRTSRRKPAAPQWVNPDWQDGTGGPPPPGPVTEPEVIINGVCVMQNQAADYSRKAGDEETVHIEPADVQDHHRTFGDDDDEENCASEVEDDEGRRSRLSNKLSDVAEVVPENDEHEAGGEKNDDGESVVETSKNGESKVEEIDDDDDEEEEGDSGWHY